SSAVLLSFDTRPKGARPNPQRNLHLSRRNRQSFAARGFSGSIFGSASGADHLPDHPLARRGGRRSGQGNRSPVGVLDNMFDAVRRRSSVGGRRVRVRVLIEIIQKYFGTASHLTQNMKQHKTAPAR